MHFDWMVWPKNVTSYVKTAHAYPGLAILWWFSLLATTTLSVTLHLHAALISKYQIGKVVAPVVMGKVQSLLLVDIVYELTVGSLLNVHPSAALKVYPVRRTCS